ncbi:MAG: hypothetical protein M3Y59_21660 [Myxococcota bacterium]|nr:hypothetical protein [Myxococcota bacterium]
MGVPMTRQVRRRRGERGFTLLIALGLITFLTVAVLFSLKFVSAQSEVMGQDRRRSEAFAAAQAGMAQASDLIRQQIGTATSTYTPVLAGFGAYTGTDNPAPTGQSWAQVYDWTQYRLTQGTGSNVAIDTSVTTEDQELRGRNGAAFTSYPEQANVRFRVFIRDDEDLDSNWMTDSNKSMWVVSIGQVTGAGGQVVAQQVVQALIRNDNTDTGTPSTYSFAGANTNSGDSAPPDLTNVPTSL